MTEQEAKQEAEELIESHSNQIVGHVFNGHYDIAIECALLEVQSNIDLLDKVANQNIELFQIEVQDDKHMKRINYFLSIDIDNLKQVKEQIELL